MHLSLLLESFLSEYIGTKAPSSHPTYRAHCKRLVEGFGDREIASITPSDVRVWIARAGITLAAASVVHRLSFLRVALDWAVEHKYIEKNPARLVKSPRVVNARYRYLTEEEEAKLKLHASPEVFSVIRFAILTGLRRGEIFNIKAKHVDWNKRLLLVADSKTRAQRVIPLHPEAYAVLYYWQAVAQELGAEYLFYPSVHPTQRWKAARRFSDSLFGPLVDLCEIEDLHGHDLRHTFATRLVEAGVTLYEVQTLLGHKDPKMTMRYAHISTDRLIQAVYRLN